MAAHKRLQTVFRVRRSHAELGYGTLHPCSIDHASSADFSDTLAIVGGASQLAAQLKLLKELCAAAKGPSQLTSLLQAVNSIMEQAGGSEKVC